MKRCKLNNPENNFMDVEWREPAVALQYKAEQLRGMPMGEWAGVCYIGLSLAFTKPTRKSFLDPECLSVER